MADETGDARPPADAPRPAPAAGPCHGCGRDVPPMRARHGRFRTLCRDCYLGTLREDSDGR